MTQATQTKPKNMATAIAAAWRPIEPIANPDAEPIAGSWILYEGPSMIDGSPIAVIVTGCTKPSANTKTGDVPQVWILRQDLDPRSAQAIGADVAVCGSCILRPAMQTARAQLGIEHACYVETEKAPRSVFAAYTRGRYARIEDLGSADDLVDAIAGRRVRLGAYGDPMAWPLESVPAESDGVSIMQFLRIAGWPVTLGYSHQWKRIRDRVLLAKWSRIVMASCDTESDAERARGLGFTPAMLDTAGSVPAGFVRCPAQVTDGRVSCGECSDGSGAGLCSGGGRMGVLFELHGHRR